MEAVSGEPTEPLEWASKVEALLVKSIPDKCLKCRYASNILIEAFDEVIEGVKSTDRAEVDIALNISVRCGTNALCPPENRLL